MRAKSSIVCLLILLVWLPVHAEETFPLPEELQPDVDFWVHVFTGVTSDEGVLHDNRSLGVVYAELDVPEKLSSRERQRRIDAERDKIQAALSTLAGGKRSGLSDFESRILSLWPDDVDNATLRAATRQVRFQRGLSDRFRAGLERSGRWREYIVREFRALGIPEDIVALPHVESSYNPAARSHVGASGIWQFTRSTGRRFMQVDHVLDERNDPYAASRAAGRLLAYNHSITGNWPTAITAYNHGLGGIRRAMREYGDTAYVDILRKYDGRTFGFASRNFYVAFLAAREVDQNPEKYFPGIRFDPPEAMNSVVLEKYISLENLSKALGVGSNEVRRNNLALQPTIVEGSKYLPKDFELRMPADSLAGPFADLVAAIPAGEWSDAQLPDLFHTIGRGETLSGIAMEYDTTVSTLVALNSLNSRHRIRAGQQLRLPAAGPLPAEEVTPAAAVVEAEVEAEVEEVVEADAGVQEVAPAALASEEVVTEQVVEAQTELLSDPSDYSVGSGDRIEVQSLETLGHFADWLGIRTQRLRDINGLAFGTPVVVGQDIRLDFSAIDSATFESRRIAYHRAQQDSYFREHVISGVTDHVIKRGDSIWVLSLREFGVPLWLFRQYNPELDLHNVRPGTTVHFPVLEDKEPE